MAPKDVLSEYNRKRDFGITREPKGKAGKRKKPALDFVVQKHGARRLHYDLRLGLDGVMKSWAVTRGPSYDPADKRLAVHVEDHPVEYNKFEGVIPEKQYGAGPVMIWDRGAWTPEGDPHHGLKKGHLTFDLAGTRMRGRWHLVRMQRRPAEKRENWLLIKGHDSYALSGKKNEHFLEKENTSLISARTLEEIRDKVPVEEIRDKVPKQKTAAKTKSASLPALQKKYPAIALATLVEFPPSGAGWLHEIKYDGYRLLAFISHGRAVLRTRGGKDWTATFPQLAEELARLKVKDAVLDGEACVLNEKGQTSFYALQTALSQGRPEKIEMWLFDLLHLDGKSYAPLPLTERKAALEKILKTSGKKNSRLHYSTHFESSPDLLEKACKLGAEGIVSKQRDAPYKGRRGRDWLKSKCGLEQEFVIGGFMPAKDNAKAIGSLLLGYYKGKKLLYAGKVGTGFTGAIARDIYRRLLPLKTGKSPFPGTVEKGRRGNIWVRPEQACEIAFWEWTPDGHIRHASLKGLREDKAPQDIREETPELPPQAGKKTQPVRKPGKSGFRVEGITISHPDREVFPGSGITKGDVARYYAEVMPYLLPFAQNRLLSLVRCPETITGECFFQRAPMKGGKGNVRGLTDDHKGSKHTYLYIDSPAGILELAQMGSIEFHAWQSRVPDIGKPDQIIFDLDPGEGVDFAAVKLAALDVRNRLKAAGLVSLPRLTGGKGLHIVSPIEPRETWDAIKPFCHNLALEMQRNAPGAYIASMSKQKRRGKIFIDYLRNDYSATAIVPFSLRARKGAPVAVPVTWRELEKISSPAAFTLDNVKDKLNAATKKIIRDFHALRQSPEF